MDEALFQLAEEMANDLREYARAAREAGCPIDKTERLIESFQTKSDQYYQFGNVELELD